MKDNMLKIIKEYLEEDRKLCIRESEIIEERVKLFQFYWQQIKAVGEKKQ